MAVAAAFVCLWLIIATWRVHHRSVTRPPPSRGPLQAPPQKPTLDVAQAEARLLVPLAEMIAQAERKAIAMHCPLDGDPRQAQVVANPVATTEVTSLIGGGVSHVPVEITAIGDRERSFIPGPPMSGADHSYSGGALHQLEAWRSELIDELQHHAVTDANRGHRPYSPAELADWDMLYAQLDEADRRICLLRKARDRARLDP